MFVVCVVGCVDDGFKVLGWLKERERVFTCIRRGRKPNGLFEPPVHAGFFMFPQSCDLRTETAGSL
jgi:hypothetical protein